MSTYRIAQKCMFCSLHFNVYSWQEDWAEAYAPSYCPECGTRGQVFTLAVVKMDGEIFEYVPGIGGTLIFERDRNEE